MQAFKGALQLTPLSSSVDDVPRTAREAGLPQTWFHARRWYSSLNSGMEVLALHFQHFPVEEVLDENANDCGQCRAARRPTCVL